MTQEGNVGTIRGVPCSSCGGSNASGMRFCGYCGAALTHPAATPNAPSGVDPIMPHEDRRLVTVLFCDLVGFTPLSEQLDPEDVREIQDAYFALVSAEIHRFGGIVEKYAGDAVLAIFGAPVAHEDDAERAVRCALAMQRALRPAAEEASQRWGATLALRIGINTGEVVSGLRATETRSDYAVTGDVVNTAARLQTAATPGGVLVGEETMRLARQSVVFGERLELQLKGKTGPVAAYPVEKARAHVVERWQATPNRTPLVGRDRELHILLRAWKRAVEGQGQLVAIVAEAGVGKSRLLVETLERVAAGRTTQVLRGRCLSYTRGAGFWLLADLLRSLFDLQEAETPERVRTQLVNTVGALLSTADAQTRSMAIDVLGEVLGLPAGGSIVARADAGLRHRVLVRSLRLLLTALSAEGPTVLALEDLHWIDASSAAVLREILSDAPHLRILVVVTRRSEWEDPLSDWSWGTTIYLQPLADDEVPALARAVLVADRLSPDLERHIAERSGGNPFFVEELLRALQESGALQYRAGEVHLLDGAAERLPSTLAGLLLARLDRLAPHPRSVAQLGSVIGRRFAVRVLAEVATVSDERLRTSLAELESAALVLSARSTELEYVFKHAAVQEVAYGTILLRRRQELHGAVARALIALYPDNEPVEVIAYHYAVTQEWLAAAHWLERAGDRAARIYANETAMSHYREAQRRLELGEAEKVELARVDEKLATILGRIGRYDQALDFASRAEAVFRQFSDLEGAGRVSALIGRWHLSRGTPQQGLARVQASIEELDRGAASHALALLFSAQARISFGSGKYQEGVRAAERASALAGAIEDRPDSPRIRAEAEMVRGTLLAATGDMEASRHVLAAAMPLAEAAGDLETLGRILVNLGHVQLNLGQLDESRAYLQRAIEVFERIGDPSAGAWLFLAMTLTYLGTWDEAAASIDRGADIVQGLGLSWYASYPPLLRGQLHLLKGDWQDAKRELTACLSLAGQTGDLQSLEQAHWLLAELDLLERQTEAALERLSSLPSPLAGHEAAILSTLARTYIEMGRVQDALETSTRALDVAGRGQNHLFVPEALRVHALVLAKQQRWQQARDALESSLSLSRDMSYPYGQARALDTYAMMQMQKGDLNGVRDRLQRALALYVDLGARVEVEHVEQTLALLGARASS